MDLATVAWLRTPEGQRLLAEAQQLYDDGMAALPAGERLRRRGPADRAAAAWTQAVLRRAAEAKLGDWAPRLLLTPDGLEQATRREVAAHRAARISFAHPSSVLDLGCGIGGDLLALAGAGLVTAGVDLDPVRAALATANLEALGLPGAVQVADGTALDLSRFGVVVADPARRTSSGRVFDPDAYLPPWSFVEQLLTRPACVKVAPGIPHDRVPAGVEAEWVSFRGEVKEAALWSPQLATTARRATVMAARGLATLTSQDDPGPVGAGPVGRWLWEPDGAVIRAGLVGAVAARVDGWLLDEHIAYVCGDQPFDGAQEPPVRSPYARAFEVLEELPFAEKRLRAALRERGIGRLTIKKRGVDVVPDVLRKRLALRGEAEGTLVLTRVAGKGTALLVRPV